MPSSSSTVRALRDVLHVVHVYAERPVSSVDRPVRWLAGFAPIRLAGGERRTVAIKVSPRRLAYWADGWQYEEGQYLLRVGTSPVALVHDCPVSLRR